MAGVLHATLGVPAKDSDEVQPGDSLDPSLEAFDVVEGRWPVDEVRPEDSLGPRFNASGVVGVKKCLLGARVFRAACGCQGTMGHRLVSSIYLPHEDVVATKALIRRALYYIPRLMRFSFHLDLGYCPHRPYIHMRLTLRILEGVGSSSLRCTVIVLDDSARESQSVPLR